MILIYFGTTENLPTDLNRAWSHHCFYTKGQGVDEQPEHMSFMLLVSLFDLRDTRILCGVTYQILLKLHFFTQQIPGEMPFQPPSLLNAFWIPAGKPPGWPA